MKSDRVDELRNTVHKNFSRIGLQSFALVISLFLIISFVFFSEGVSTVERYIGIQQDLFFFLNGELSKLPALQLNLTHFGDPLILFPLFTLFILMIPKLWEAVLTSTLLAAVVSFSLKELIDVPRPAEYLSHDSFAIIGAIHKGFSSLPSGHSITTFTAITLVLVAFMPKKLTYKIGWTILLISLGYCIALSRVGIGAHYPLDVLFGSIIGYSVSLFAIVLNRKINWWSWMSIKKYYTLVTFLLLVWIAALIRSILIDNLLVFYFSFLALVFTLYQRIKFHVQKEN